MKTKAAWPDEALVFEVIGSCYRGEIVEGIGFGEHLFGGVPEDIHFRFTSNRRNIITGSDNDGYHYTQLKPLTPAAEAMLAIAREGAK